MRKEEPMTFEKRSDQELDFHAESIKKLQEIFEKEFKLFIFPMFGTLIGACRENDFVKTDNDIDMLWIAKGKNRLEVCRHVMSLYHELQMRELFYGLGPVAGQCNVRLMRDIVMPDGARGHGGTVIDVFAGWEENGDLYTCQWGNYGKIDLRPAKTKFRNQELLVPNGAGVMLTHLYGDWRVPRQSKPDTPHLKMGHYLIQP